MAISIAPVVTASAPVGGPASHDRVVSVDALRGLVITLMIFVNDVAGGSGIPSWLRHASAKDDAMTVPDVVFPAFLFIAGVSIPLAFGRALASGANRFDLLGKVLGRTGVLLGMGVLMVNEESFSPWHHAWGALVYVAMLLAFAVVPRAPGPARTRWQVARFVGGGALLALALAYRNRRGQHLLLGPLFDPTDTVWLRHSWWGILGLIGWAYLVASVVYLFFGRRREWLIGATGLLMMVYVADRSGMAARLASRAWLEWATWPMTAAQGALGWVGAHVSIAESFGSLAGTTMAGCCLGAILLPSSEVGTPRARLRWAAVFLVGLIGAAVLFDPLYGLNKIRATPSWCLVSAAIATAAWMILYWRLDLCGRGGWTRWVRPAGANPLLAYLLHPLLYLVADVAGLPIDFYHGSNLPVAVNIAGSAVMAIAVVQITGLIARTGYRLKA
jgi:heparan-alpha-glucosaminide N-acetyltransferase